MIYCPWCRAKAIDVTSSKDMNGFDKRPRYICTGAKCHEWRDGDAPDPADGRPRLVVLA